MVIFFDEYTEDVKKLQETICGLNQEIKMISLKDDGFLPKGIGSPYEYYVSRQNQEKHEERELFYDFLNVPEFWEIRLKGSVGAIYDMGVEKAEIHFTEPIEKRNVHHVEWHMENGWVYEIDFYNKYGLKYASEFRDMDGNIESKVFYSDKNQEVIVVQPQNDVITLTEKGITKAFFTSQMEFFESYIKECVGEEKCALFVQNERTFVYLNRNSNEEANWKCVWFSNDELLNKYKEMGGKNGFKFLAMPECYPENRAKGEALILTASDWIEKIGELTDELPDMIFHIAAHTQMSSKLYKLAERENVKLYPCVSMENLKELWGKCDFYLDINHYREIHDAVNMAYQRNLLIMGFENTLHHKEMLVKGCMFANQDYKKMVLVIKYLIGNPILMNKLLLVQQKKRRELWKNFLEL